MKTESKEKIASCLGKLMEIMTDQSGLDFVADCGEIFNCSNKPIQDLFKTANDAQIGRVVKSATRQKYTQPPTALMQEIVEIIKSDAE